MKITPLAKEKKFHDKKFWGRISTNKNKKMLINAQNKIKNIVLLRNSLGAGQKLPISYHLRGVQCFLVLSQAPPKFPPTSPHPPLPPKLPKMPRILHT